MISGKGIRVPLSRSIATKLLVAVFSVYVVITIALTALHMTAEYVNTKHSVLQEIEALATTFTPGLGTAIYNVDSEGIRSMVKGMVRDPNVVGAVVQTEYQGMFSEGEIGEGHGGFKEQVAESGSAVTVENFSASVPIHYQEVEGEGVDIGLLTLYSSNDVVLSKVWFALGIIFINAVIKTVALWVIFLLFSRRYLVRPLAELTEATTRVRLVDLERHKVSIDTPGENELKVLADAFNTMIDTLAHARQESDRLQESLEKAKGQVEDYNRTLEQRVEQRTRQLRQAKEAAEDATAFKSAFLANMSHEIRTPMNVVLGMTDLLEEARPDAEQKRLLEILRKSGISLLRLIDDILDLSKVEAGQVELESIPFDLVELVDSLCKGEAVRAHAKGVEVVCRVAPELDGLRLGDPTRLGQVLRNLLGNAVKFTNKGEVVLSVSPGRDEALRFDVMDTGIGVPSDKLNTIFDTFAQADSSTTRKYGGTGLGLAICKQLVQLMGGSIEAQARDGSGAVFSFEITLPRTSDPQFDPKPVDLSGRRILVAEANDALRQSLLKRIQAWGGEVVETIRFDEAQAQFSKAIDMALLGDRLEGGRGIDVAEGADKALQERIVLLVSTNMDSETRARVSRLPARVIYRPMGAGDLREVVRSLLPPHRS